MQKFYPDCYIPSIFALPISLLKQQNIQTICFDFDNTLVSYDADKNYQEKTIRFLKQLKKDFHIIIISNSFHGKRVKQFADSCNISYICKALKPSRHGFKKVDSTSNHTAMVGDQLLTDILGAKRNHWYTILVDPIAPKENKGTKINRFLEKRIFHQLGFQRGEYYEKKM